MNFLILGDGAEEHAWAVTITASGDHRLIAAYPGFFDFDELPRPRDLDDALAVSGIDAVLVGGAIAERGEALRRAAGAGLAVIALHPPGEDSEAYYQVAMSRAETGAVIVPALGLRLHPGVEVIRQAVATQLHGGYRELRFEAAEEGDLVRVGFARAIDVVRSILGEIEAVTATGDPPGPVPTENLVVQVRGSEGRRAEIRLTPGKASSLRLSYLAAEGTLALEVSANLEGPARLVDRPAEKSEIVSTIQPFPSREGLLDVLTQAVARRSVHPDLLDGTRAMEVTEGVVRSLRRGRTVELHYENISEEGTFKGVMTSLGCVLLMAILAVLPLALAGPALGLAGTVYLAYLIPPVLVIFVLLQLFRYAIRR